MPRKAQRKSRTSKVVKEQKPPVVPVQKEESKGGFFEYLRFGESYTSLILGIIVVIISTVLILSFVHNKNVGTSKNNEPQKTQIAQGPTEDVALSTSPMATVKPTTVVTLKPTLTVKPTVKPTSKPTVTVIPSKKAVATATTAPKATAVPTVAPKAEAPRLVEGKSYTVVEGDTLWLVAEKTYKSGYNWVDIARVNNLSNPDYIEAGTKLSLPKVEAKTATVVESKNSVQPSNQVVQAQKITGSSYKVAQGDALWDIAVRAYGDGYKWVEISRANKLSNPNVIHPGNVLQIPR